MKIKTLDIIKEINDEIEKVFSENNDSILEKELIKLEQVLKTNLNKELPEVNEYIKMNKLEPNDTELIYGGLYDDDLDRTYLVVDKDNTYMSLSSLFYALMNKHSENMIVICKGRIKNE